MLDIFALLLILQPEPAVDMKQRFIGHCNIGTDIKQANFLGQRGMLFHIVIFYIRIGR